MIGKRTSAFTGDYICIPIPNLPVDPDCQALLNDATSPPQALPLPGVITSVFSLSFLRVFICKLDVHLICIHTTSAYAKRIPEHDMKLAAPREKFI